MAGLLCANLQRYINLALQGFGNLAREFAAQDTAGV